MATLDLGTKSMNIINHIRDTYSNTRQLNDEFVGTPPYPMIVLDNFLPKEIALSMEQECNAIPEKYWSEFTRRNSYMQECVNLDVAPEATQFVSQMHSQQIMTWLTKMTGIKDLIPDPYLVGAGYSKSFRGNTLKMHTDFNWNDKMKVHRMLSLIVYLNSDWQEEWGGHLQFNDFDNKTPVQRIAPLFNRAIIWRHHKRGFHGFPEPLQCPDNMSRKTFRLFFYVSNATYNDDDRPHRSLYWFDDELGEPYDIPTHK